MIAAGDPPVVDPHLIGLARVSTDSQDTQLQRDALVQAGCARIFEETISTRSSQRPGLTAALDHLRPHAGQPGRVEARPARANRQRRARSCPSTPGSR